MIPSINVVEKSVLKVYQRGLVIDYQRTQERVKVESSVSKGIGD